MRVLVATPSLPLPFGEAVARCVHVVVTGLASRGHDVVCLACTEGDDKSVADAHAQAAIAGYEFRHVPLLLPDTNVVARRLASLSRPFSEYERVAELREVFDEEARLADVVHLEQLYFSRIGVTHPRAVTYLHHLELIDWEHRTEIDLRTRVVRRQMKRATAQILGESSRVIVGTNRLADRVLHINPRLRVSVVPGSIDVDLYPVLPHPAEPVVGLIGSMNWYPSHSAADRVMRKLWPEIHRMVPDSRLIVAGRGSSEKLAHHFLLAGAELLGTVARPEDFFSSISVLLYPPTRGSGIKIKVLEAMAYGRAVVSNAEGLEGFGDRGEIVAVQAETDDEFIEHTVSLLNNPQRRAALGSAGRSQVAEVYSVQPATDRLLDAYEQVGLVTGARR